MNPSTVITPHHAAVSQHMTFDFFHQLPTGQPCRQSVRRKVQGVELNNVMVRAVTHRRAWADVARGAFAVNPRSAFEGGFGTDTGRNLPGHWRDTVMNPVIDAEAFLTIRVMHDDRVALRACGASVPTKRRGLILAAAAICITGRDRSEQAVVGDTGHAEREAFLGLRRKLHANGEGNRRQPRVQKVGSGHTGAPCAGEAVVGVQTIAGPFVRWQWQSAEPRPRHTTLKLNT